MLLSFIDNAVFSVVDIPVVLYALNFKLFVCISPSFNILVYCFYLKVFSLFLCFQIWDKGSGACFEYYFECRRHFCYWNEKKICWFFHLFLDQGPKSWLTSDSMIKLSVKKTQNMVCQLGVLCFDSLDFDLNIWF